VSETPPAVELARCPTLTDQVPYAYASVVEGPRRPDRTGQGRARHSA